MTEEGKIYAIFVWMKFSANQLERGHRRGQKFDENKVSVSTEEGGTSAHYQS